MSWLKLARRFQADTSGTTAVEYAVIAFVMAFALLACLPFFSSSVGALFASVVGAI
ncbi:MAG: Flp family type IVb pilin [Alphaproteobacteria bacterium]|nr:Flp family type IVb pilin [Alphaproteobacteria bacterium]